MRALRRTVQIYDVPQQPEPYVSEGSTYSWLVPKLWNDQLYEDTACILEPEAPGCPHIDLSLNLQNIRFMILTTRAARFPLPSGEDLKM